MTLQSRIDRRKHFKRFYRHVLRYVLLFTGLAWFILFVLRWTRHEPVAYILSFLLIFGVFFTWEFRRKHMREIFEGDD